MVPKLRFKEFCGEWEKVKLKDISYIIKRKNDKKIHPIMMISAEYGFIDQSKKYSKYNAGNSIDKYILLYKHELAYNRGNSKLRKYGCIFELNEKSAIVPYVYHCFSVNKNNSSNFYGKYLNSGKIDKELVKIISSTARMDGLLNVSEKNFFDINISNPCIEEQTKIADFLSTVDDKIHNQQDKITHLENIKKGFMQKIFSRKIRFKDDVGEEFPEWEDKKLKEIGNISTGTTPSTKNNEYFGGSYLWVTPSDINQNKDIKNTERKLSEKGLRKGRVIEANSIMVTCIASIGKNCIIREKGSCNQQINAITPSKKYNVDFIYYAISTIKNKMIQLAGQTATPILNKVTFENLEINIPCIEEQQKIADFLSSFDEKISTEKEILEHLKQLKKGLLQQMFV